jgi:hypothetical protein
MIENLSDARQFFQAARPGQACEYWYGFLARDCDLRVGDSAETMEIKRLAIKLRHCFQVAQHRGIVALSQKRIASDRYSYFATRTNATDGRVAEFLRDFFGVGRKAA